MTISCNIPKSVHIDYIMHDISQIKTKTYIYIYIYGIHVYIFKAYIGCLWLIYMYMKCFRGLCTKQNQYIYISLNLGAQG